jgi:hypothetical protein
MQVFYELEGYTEAKDEWVSIFSGCRFYCLKYAHQCRSSIKADLPDKLIRIVKYTPELVGD